MKFVRLSHENHAQYGILEGERINIIEGDIFSEYRLTGTYVALKDIKLLAPCMPGKAVCVGLNYYDHAQEMNLKLPSEPLIFLKPTSTVNDPNGDIDYPSLTNNLHYEAELAVVIGKKTRKISSDEAESYILGYTCANDVTARDIQHTDGQWTRAKSFDTFLPLGPCIATDIDPHSLDISLYLNGNLKQSSNTSNLIFSIPEIVSFVSQVMTLNPGDVILTGTPAGVGPMEIDDTVEIVISGIGTLSNKVGLLK